MRVISAADHDASTDPDDAPTTTTAPTTRRRRPRDGNDHATAPTTATGPTTAPLLRAFSSGSVDHFYTT